MSDNYTQPTAAEVFQDELRDVPAAPVRIIGPIEVRQLPGVISTFHAHFIDASSGAVRILKEDPRRFRAVLISAGGPVPYIGNSKSAVEGGVNQKGGPYFKMPDGRDIELFTSDEVWALTEGGLGCTVSVLEEYWAS